MGIRGSFIEIRRRRVLRAAGLYIVGAWAAVQVISLVLPAVDIPDTVLRDAWPVALLLFPLVVIFARFHELSADGLVRTPPACNAERFDPSLRRADYRRRDAASEQ